MALLTVWMFIITWEPWWCQDKYQKKTGVRGRSLWGVEVEVEGKGQNDEQIPTHQDQVQGEEQPKEEWLEFWVL